MNVEKIRHMDEWLRYFPKEKLVNVFGSGSNGLRMLVSKFEVSYL